MIKTVTQLIIEAKDKTTAVFKSIASSIRSTGKAAEEESGEIDKASSSVEKLSAADKKLAAEQNKLNLSAEKLVISERQLAAQFDAIAREAKDATTAEQKLAVQRKRLAAASKSLTNDQRRLAIQQRQVGINAKIAAKNQGEFSRGVKASSKSVSGLTGILKSAGAGLLAFFAVQKVIEFVKGVVQTADAFKLVQGRIKLATDGLDEYVRANASLFAIAQRTRSGFGDLAVLFSRTNEAIKNLGLTQADTLNFVELIGQANKVSGASASESAASIRQLTQALQSGVLRGDEFNSVMENSPRIAKALAAGLGVPIGALRKMAEEGELTADRVIKAILSQRDAINTEFTSIPKTVSGVVTQLRNIWNKGIGELDTGAEFSKAIIGIFELLQDRLSSIFTFLKTNASSIGDAFKVLVALLTFQANIIRIAFNTVTALVSFFALTITSALELISRAASLVTFGDASKKWKQQADEIAEVSKALANQVVTDARDIGEGVQGIFGGADSTSLDRPSIEVNEEQSTQDARSVSQRIADEINKTFAGVNPVVDLSVNADGVEPAAADIKNAVDSAGSSVDALNAKLKQSQTESARTKQSIANALGDISVDAQKSTEELGATDVTRGIDAINRALEKGNFDVAQRGIQGVVENITKLNQTELGEQFSGSQFLQAQLGRLQLLQEKLDTFRNQEQPAVDVEVKADTAPVVASILAARDQAQQQIKPVVIPVVVQRTGNSFTDSRFSDEIAREALKRGRRR